MTVVTVPVADRPECIHALKVAVDLAKRLDGQVMGYHLHPHRDDDRKIPTGSGSAKGALKLFESVAEEADMPVLHKLSARKGSAAHWREMVGSPYKVMPIIAPVSDMVVVSRPKGNGKGATGKVARDFLLEALRKGGRPTLVVPQRKIKSIGKRILIAWDQSRAVTQSIQSSLPLLQAADEVQLHCAGADYHHAPKAHHMRSYLALNGIKCRITTSRGLFIEDELEEAYAAMDADLMVMGAYSRARVVEQLLGGTTEHFLMKAKIPVLSTHSVG